MDETAEFSHRMARGRQRRGEKSKGGFRDRTLPGRDENITNGGGYNEELLTLRRLIMIPPTTATSVA